MSKRFVDNRFQQVDVAGTPIIGSFAFYLTGTSTPLVSYSNAGCTTANANPINADSNGRFGPIWFTQTTWAAGIKAIYYSGINATGSVVFTDDPIAYDTAADVATLLKPRTPIEIAAGVVPTYYQYDPGDPFRYGAAGGGAANDSAAVASALLSSNQVVFRDRFGVSSQQTVTRVGQNIYGYGFTTGLVALSGGFDVLVSQANDVTYSDFYVFGGAVAQPGAGITGQKGISATAASPALRNHVVRVGFSGITSGSGLNVGIKGDTGCNGWTVDGVFVNNLWGSNSGFAGYGVLVGGCDGWRVNDSQFVATSGRGRHAVYLSAGSTDCKATNCDAYGFYAAGFTGYTTASQSTSSDIGFDNCRAFNCSTGAISTDGAISLYGKITRPFVRNCKVYNSDANGIVADAFGTTMTDFISEGNEVYETELRGIDVLGVARVSISGGLVHESSQAASGVDSNIRIVTDGTTAASKISVLGVKSTGTAFARSPLQINSSAPAPSDITILGNAFESGVTDHCEFNGIAAKTDLTFEKLIANSATPSVAGYNHFRLSQAGATNVTAFLNSVEGQLISIRFLDGNSTVVDAVGVQLAGGANFAATADDILVLQRRGSVWYEVSRSVN